MNSDLIHLFVETFGISQEKLQPDATLESHARKLDDRLGRLLALKPKGAVGEKLRQVFKKCRQNLFVFATRRDLPPTNNGSERAIRSFVVFRKVTNCFRTEWGAGKLGRGCGRSCRRLHRLMQSPMRASIQFDCREPESYRPSHPRPCRRPPGCR